MTRRAVLLFHGLLLTIVLLACAELPDKGHAQARPGEPLVLGVAAALSGPLAAEGEAIVNGARLATERFGAIRGHPVQVEVVDDGCAAAQSEAAAMQLSGDPRLIGIVGPSCSPGCVAAARALDQPSIVLITPRCTDIAVTRQGFGHIFRTSRTDALELVAAAEFLDQRLKVRRVFLVHDGTLYGRNLRDVFKLIWGKDNLAGNVEALTGTEDYGPVVRSIRNSNAGAVYYAGFAEDAVRFIAQLRAVGVQLPVVGPDTLKIDGGIAHAGTPAVEGVYMTEAEPLKGRGSDEFLAAYRARYGNDPGPSAAEAYDAALVLLTAARRVARAAGDTVLLDRRDLLAAVAKTDLDGISGRVRFRENGDRRNSVLVRIYRVEHGRYTEQAVLYPE
jgi:branched-chain amino acid transport system substrate-binding protein